MEWQINQQQEPEEPVVPVDSFDRERLRRTLRRDEGRHLFVYDDADPRVRYVDGAVPDGNWTLGVGHLIENPLQNPLGTYRKVHN